MALTASYPGYRSLMGICNKLCQDDDHDFGDLPHDSDEEDDFIIDAEPQYRYHPNNTLNGRPQPIYYPICLGEVLKERYQIEHKLGHGHYCTVWMAHDLRDKRDVALKIMATSRHGESLVEHEVGIHDEIRRIPGVASKHLVTYLDTFFVTTSGRNHRVLVLPLLSPGPWLLEINNMSTATRVAAAKQLLEALEALHSVGIVHRDLSEGNCLWGMAPLHDLPRRSKYDLLHRPVKKPIVFAKPDVLSKPGEIILPLKVPSHLYTHQFYLGDFNLAMHVDNPVVPMEGFPSPRFCSPDRLHQKHPSLGCDMWSYMVIFSQLYLGCPPFGTIFPAGIIEGIISSLGPLPEEWKGQYIDPEKACDWWYDPHTEPDPKEDLALLIKERKPDVDEEERELVLSIMKKVFRYRPEERMTASELLQDSEFRALMQRYGC